jgi:hypothetical protein
VALRNATFSQKKIIDLARDMQIVIVSDREPSRTTIKERKLHT